MKKWALIAGGSGGIGLAAAQKLAKEGFNLIIVHRDRRSELAQLEETFNDLRKLDAEVHALNFDGTNEDKIASALETFLKVLAGAKIHLFLHAISRGNLKPLVSKEEKHLSDQDLTLTFRSMGSNLLSWVNALLENDLFGPGARVIALTSEGNDKVWQGYGAVALAKASLETLVNYLAVELAPFNIRVNTIQAGVTDTFSLRMIPGYERLLELTKKRNPYKRITTPEDVANVVYLLSTKEASWVNGSKIHVDGGEHLVG